MIFVLPVLCWCQNFEWNIVFRLARLASSCSSSPWGTSFESTEFGSRPIETAALAVAREAFAVLWVEWVAPWFRDLRRCRTEFRHFECTRLHRHRSAKKNFFNLCQRLEEVDINLAIRTQDICVREEAWGYAKII